MSIGQMFYIWNTYTTSILKYGAAIFFRQNDRSEYDIDNPALQSIEALYNKTFKMLCKIPAKAEKSKINTLLGEKAFKYIVLKKAFKVNNKWLNVYQNDYNNG